MSKHDSLKCHVTNDTFANITVPDHHTEQTTSKCNFAFVRAMMCFALIDVDWNSVKILYDTEADEPCITASQ